MPHLSNLALLLCPQHTSLDLNLSSHSFTPPTLRPFTQGSSQGPVGEAAYSRLYRAVLQPRVLQPGIHLLPPHGTGEGFLLGGQALTLPSIFLLGGQDRPSPCPPSLSLPFLLPPPSPPLTLPSSYFHLLHADNLPLL